MTYITTNLGISRRHALTLTASIFLGTLGINAQTVKGTVLDARTHEPIIGAIVSVKTDKGTSAGASTDVDGRFSLDVKQVPATLIVSYTGYKNEEVSIYEVTDDELEINLNENFNILQGVVIVGYGTQKRENLSGSISTVNVSDIQKGVSASVNSLLEGSTPGLTAVPASGQPGAGVSLRVRGGSSIQGGNEPLYVIDGFPVYNSKVSSGAIGDNGTYSISAESNDPLSAINPGDIESITVLKDASATAIYGSRGANGVVIITTKQGKQGDKVKLTYEGSFGVQHLRKKYDVLNARDFAALHNEALYDANPAGGEYQYLTQDEIDAIGNGTDWQDEAYRSAIVTNHQLSITGGSEKTRFAVSGNYFRQDGILRNTGFDRINGRVNLNTKVSKRLNAGINFTASKTSSKLAPAGIALGVLQMPPTLSVYDAHGNYTSSSPFELAYKNPVATLEETTNKSTNYRVLGSAFGEYELVKDLKLKVLVGADVNLKKDAYYSPSTLYESAALGGVARIGHVEQTSWVNENTLSYNKVISSKHSISLLAGFTQQKNTVEITRTGSSDYNSDALTYNSLQSGANISTPFSDKAVNTMISYLGRISYDYAQKHDLTFSIRTDGSSRFGKDKKWGTFPSVGYSYNVSNEKFFRPLKRILSDAKIRLSYGVTGNQEIDNYQSLATLSSNRYFFGNQKHIGYYPDRIANDKLGWETTRQLDAGLDLGLLKGRITLVLDYYHKKTSDLLLNVALPYTTGFSTSLQNYGTVVNQGFELAINSQNIQSRKFTWDTNFSLSLNRNKVKNLGGSSSAYISTNLYYATIIEEGKPLGCFYGAVYDGVLQSGEETTKGKYTYNQSGKAGDRLYKDVNHDGSFSNANDRTVIGNAEPDFTFTLNNKFSYRNFDLSIFVNGSVGNDIANLNRARLSLFTGLQNAIGDAVNRWTPNHPSTSISRAKGSDPATVFSSEFIEDGSFLKVKNVTLGYTFPKPLLKSLGLEGLRLYATATNLLTFTGYSGYDPEVTTSGNSLAAGIDFGNYPSAKTYNFGVVVNF